MRRPALVAGPRRYSYTAQERSVGHWSIDLQPLLGYPVGVSAGIRNGKFLEIAVSEALSKRVCLIANVPDGRRLTPSA